MNILVLDNYDSFTYNLVQYIQEILDRDITVRRNDAISLEEVSEYDAVVLSPGPGLPAEAGIMPQLIKKYAGKIPILGVCLGHQAIGEAFGAQLENLADVFHGVETSISVTDQDEPLFKGMGDHFQAGRYHSWVVSKTDLPDCFTITAVDEKGTIMAMRHNEYNIRGLQFHPESIMTKTGRQLLRNFFEECVPVKLAQ